jgi:hypothetical protein
MSLPKAVLKPTCKGLVRWLALAIPAIQEVEIRRIVVQGQPGQKVHNTPSQPPS